MASSQPPIAIPTYWRGVQFRSRLEARWAAVFHALNWSWEYEPATYDVDIAEYTPDFWISEIDAHVEIKPIETIDHRWLHFGHKFGPLHVIEGSPPENLHRRNPLDAYAIKTYDTLTDGQPSFHGSFAACAECRHIYVSRPGTYCPRGCQRLALEHETNITDIRLARAFQYSRDQFLENV